MSWKILTLQPELKPYEGDINARMDRFIGKKRELLGLSQTLGDFANGHMFYGLHKTQTGWVYREWAPAASNLALVGDFNGWNHFTHPLHSIGNGSWEITLEGHDSLPHLCRFKVAVTSRGNTLERIPLYANYVCQNVESRDFCAVVWDPGEDFTWEDQNYDPRKDVPPLIYEAHVGMASEEYRVASYREFADNILPRIKRDGYNTVQLMAIMEHPYYGSFGYQVSNFFAPSSRFGTPDDLKYLVNKAHKLGINVLLDLVHSHAVKNTGEGINCFDGTVYQFFHDGDKGNHPAWDSKVFDYGRNGVLHFLLSNLKYWLDVYHFDGFRFDGVTSMLYHHHGLGVDFTGPEKYFSMDTDVDAVCYLQLATELIHQVKPGAVLISEDMSAMPGMCIPVADGGIGFDYRLSMGMPDFYIKTLKEKQDGHWDMGQLVWNLQAKRNGEKRIAYAESHDQAIVGDQTLISRMMGAEIYTGMTHWMENITADRAVALHKMIRLITICAGGEGYLNFMGNEFGHPEWIDSPREGNGWSHHYCRRQWSLEENHDLRYGQLGAFDKAMVSVIKKNKILASDGAQCIRFHQDDQVVAFERNNLIFAFNFHPTNSQTGLFLPVKKLGEYEVVLSTDDPEFGGHGNIKKDTVYYTWNKDAQFGDGFAVYLPARTAMVLKKKPTPRKTRK